MSAFERLLAFLRRLERLRRSYHLEPRLAEDAIRVLTWTGAERWEVDFHASGEVEVLLDGERQDGLEALFVRLRDAFALAAADLGVRFETPFHLGPLVCTGRLPDFGGPKGTVILSLEDPDEAHERAEAQGYATSTPDPRLYELYERDRFVSLLRAWGYRGPEERRPAWLDE